MKMLEMLMFAVPVLILAMISSPFIMMFYLSKRNAMFQNLAKEYGLAFTIRNVSYYDSRASGITSPETPILIRSIEGTVQGKHIVIGDYVRWYKKSPLHNGNTRTMATIDSAEQNLNLSPFWGLASEQTIRSVITR